MNFIKRLFAGDATLPILPSPGRSGYPARDLPRAARTIAGPPREAVQTRKRSTAIIHPNPDRRHPHPRRRSAHGRRRLTGGDRRSCSGIWPATSLFTSGAWCRCRADLRQSSRSFRAAHQADRLPPPAQIRGAKDVKAFILSKSDRRHSRHGAVFLRDSSVGCYTHYPAVLQWVE